jgi:hypothetical protein
VSMAPPMRSPAGVKRRTVMRCSCSGATAGSQVKDHAQGGVNLLHLADCELAGWLA